MSSKRKRRSGPRRTARVVLALAIVGGGATGAVALTRSTVFGLSTIQITGLHSVARGDVLSAAGVQVGKNSMGLDLNAIAARVRGVAGVADARVQRLGALGLRISVEERVPALEVRAGDARAWFDQDGAPIGSAETPKGRFPIIVVAPSRPATDSSATDSSATDSSSSSAHFQPAVVDPFAGIGPNARATLTLWKQLPGWARASITRFVATPDDELVFRMYGAEIVFGTPDLVRPKLRAIALVRERADADGARLTHLDVRAPTHPAARLK